MMATFTSVPAFVQSIGEYGTRIKDAEPRALQAAALAATKDIRAAGDGFHITARSGRKIPLKAGFTIMGDQAVITARGPWMLIEKGARPHAIPKKVTKRRKRVVTPYGVFRQVHHPGTHGPIGHPWEQGVARAKVSGPKAFRDSMGKVFV